MTALDLLYFLLVMQTSGLIVGIFLSVLFHWTKWN